MQEKNDKTSKKCFYHGGTAVLPVSQRDAMFIWLGVHDFRQSDILRSMSVCQPEQAHACIRAAIIHRSPIAAFYRGRRRLLCPHLLGWNRNRRLRVLCYQYGGDSESGLEPAGATDNWRCLAVEHLSQVELIDGPWQTAQNHSRPQNCIEDVELDVDDYAEPASPSKSTSSKSAKV